MALVEQTEAVAGVVLILLGGAMMMVTAVGVDLPLFALAVATVLIAVGTLLTGLGSDVFEGDEVET
jgi:hypothetical protein